MSRPIRHAALWVVWMVALLLLKAAMPLLASASAGVQGKALVEVCTVYGVKTLPLIAAGSSPGPHDTSTHAGDTCALSGLLGLPAPPLGDRRESSPARERVAWAAGQPWRVFDASAAWLSRHQHGPPSTRT